MLQPVIAFLEEGFGLRRRGSILFLAIMTMSGTGFVLYYSANSQAMNTFDFWVGTVFIYILALFQALIYGWIFGIERGEREAHQGAHLRIPRVVQYLLKYVVPIYLVVLFGAFCYQNLPSRVTTPDKNAEVVKMWGWLSDGGVMWAGVFGENVPAEYGIVADDSGSFVGSEQFSYSQGWIERILTEEVIGKSFLFLGVIFVVLLVMIHFAGRRWVREGRYEAIDEAT
jgi:hypothetical protein